jgi:disulfide bond formation protein DsbB
MIAVLEPAMTTSPTTAQPTRATNRTAAGRNEIAYPAEQGLREVGAALLIACAVASPILWFGGRSAYSGWQQQEAARVEAVALSTAHDRLVAADPGAKVALDEAVHGRELFASTCAACHGPDAKGIKGLGKNLTVSNFVAHKDDSALAQFILSGRPDAKPLPMPPKGGNADLTDTDIHHVVAYLRGLQDPRRMPELPAVVANAAPSEAQKSAALAAAGGDAELAEYIASGNKIFHTSCVACHGKAGVGIPGNGKVLVKNEFIKSQSDDELLAFIKQGRAPSDPKNTTGIQMPPKGGNPAMSDDDILDVISYLRSLEGNRQNLAQGK